jgi:hypothetical protein
MSYADPSRINGLMPGPTIEHALSEVGLSSRGRGARVVRQALTLVVNYYRGGLWELR